MRYGFFLCVDKHEIEPPGKEFLLTIDDQILVYNISILIFNVFFHPLRRFPGPKLYAASSLPYTYHVIKGDLACPVIESLHERYGDVVRIAPDRLSFIKSEAWKDIYAFKGPYGQNPKDRGLVAHTKPGMVPGLFSADDQLHHRYRRLLAPAFSMNAVEEQEGLVTKYFDKMIRELKIAAAKDSQQDMGTWVNATILDIIGDLTFGEPLSAGEYQGFIETVLEGLKMGRVVGHLRAVYPLARWMIAGLARPMGLNKKYLEFHETIAVGVMFYRGERLGR